MGISSSRTISIQVGRNDPCSCGSGKKYKKCCLLKQEANPYNPEEKERLLKKFNKAIENLPGYSQLLKNEVEPKLKGFITDNQLEESDFAQVMEAVYFEGKMAGKKITDLVMTTLPKYDPDTEKVKKIVEQNKFGVYLVKEVRLGEWIEMEDIVTEEVFRVWEQTGTTQAKPGMYFATRLIPCGDDWTMTGQGMVLPEGMGYTMSRMMKRAVDKRQITQLEWVEMLGNNGNNDDKLEKMQAELNKDVEEVKKPGAKEQALMQQMMQELGQRDIPLARTERERILKQWTQEWINVPQSELLGATPEQVIIAERKELGNPEPIPEYIVGMETNQPESAEEYNQGVWYQKWETAKALACFARVKLEEVPDKYRFLTNVGACFVEWGMWEEGRKLLNSLWR